MESVVVPNAGGVG